MSNVVVLCCLVGQLIIMYFSHKMRRDAIRRERNTQTLREGIFRTRRCSMCTEWYAHPENEGMETDCPFKYHPRESDHCSCWSWREETEC